MKSRPCCALYWVTNICLNTRYRKTIQNHLKVCPRNGSLNKFSDTVSKRSITRGKVKKRRTDYAATARSDAHDAAVGASRVDVTKLGTKRDLGVGFADERRY